ncbi:MAG: hypothetical protein FWC50_04585 [Planctomycetaceae bacterium]|nr:hypothetical protein [Planctomycetaceae bacterium]
MQEPEQLPTKTGAFFKGGCGCLLAFVAIAVLALLLGGTAHADPLGIVFLFLIGGGLGLLVRWIYIKGFDAGHKP